MMKKEYTICKICIINQTCDKRLVPYNFSKEDEKREIPPDLFISNNVCGNYSCNTGGIQEAAEAIGRIDENVKYPVMLASGELEARPAAPFGTRFKPTEPEALRIVDTYGQIYALGPFGIYYPTQQI